MRYILFDVFLSSNHEPVVKIAPSLLSLQQVFRTMKNLRLFSDLLKT